MEYSPIGNQHWSYRLLETFLYFQYLVQTPDCLLSISKRYICFTRIYCRTLGSVLAGCILFTLVKTYRRRLSKWFTLGLVLMAWWFAIHCLLLLPTTVFFSLLLRGSFHACVVVFHFLTVVVDSRLPLVQKASSTCVYQSQFLPSTDSKQHGWRSSPRQ